MSKTSSNNMSYLSDLDQDAIIFRLTGLETLFSLGTIKIKKIVPYQVPTELPSCHSHVIGLVTICGTSIPVIELYAVMAESCLPYSECYTQTFIVVDCMNMQVALMVGGVENSTSYDKELVTPLSDDGEVRLLDRKRYRRQLVQLLDVESLLKEIFPTETDEKNVKLSQEEVTLLQKLNVMVLDETSIMRRLIPDILSRFGLTYQFCHSGGEALGLLFDNTQYSSKFDIVISNHEIIELNGYELLCTTNNNLKTKAMHTYIHSSLSGEISPNRMHNLNETEAVDFELNEEAFILAMLLGSREGLIGHYDN
ncbi:chemotaxis protein [Vibrio cyclitrophicus]|uniref:chemotaxis protein n=1 Tax=Vibrio cyclitrophicus TaxID=47951 RepID=UPI0039907DE0